MTHRHEWKEEWNSSIAAMEIICRACPIAHHPLQNYILSSLNAREALTAEMAREIYEDARHDIHCDELIEYASILEDKDDEE